MLESSHGLSFSSASKWGCRLRNCGELSSSSASEVNEGGEGLVSDVDKMIHSNFELKTKTE